MRTNELMIGDWVSIPHIGKIGKVYRVDQANGKGNGYAAVIDGDFNESLLKAIPLTVEILKKNGWKDISDHTLKGCETFKLHYEQEGFDYYITIKLRDYFKLDSYDDRFYTLCEMEFGCRYVHELQHALRLCGLTELANNFRVN